MTDYYDKTRLVVAKREDERYPMVIAAFPESTWEVIPPEEWDAKKRKWAEEFFDADWPLYDYIEVIVTISNAELAAMFAAREITPVAVERADD